MALVMKMELGSWYGKLNRWDELKEEQKDDVNKILDQPLVRKKIKFPKKKYNKIEINKKGKITVGSEQDNNIILDSKKVSGKHCEIYISKPLFGKMKIKVKDLDSKMGTGIRRDNETIHVGKEWQKLQKGDKLIIDHTILDIEEAS